MPSVNVILFSKLVDLGPGIRDFIKPFECSPGGHNLGCNPLNCANKLLNYIQRLKHYNTNHGEGNTKFK